MRVISYISTCVLFFYSAASVANWTDWGTVTEVISHEGTYIVYTNISNQTCTKTGNFYWKRYEMADNGQEVKNEDADDMYSMALSALMGGREIAVTYDPDEQKCLFNHISPSTRMRIR